MLNMDLEFVEVILVLYSLEFSVYHLSKVFPGRIKATKPAKTAMTLTNPVVLVVIVDTCEQEYIRCNAMEEVTFYLVISRGEFSLLLVCLFHPSLLQLVNCLNQL